MSHESNSDWQHDLYRPFPVLSSQEDVHALAQVYTQLQHEVRTSHQTIDELTITIQGLQAALAAEQSEKSGWIQKYKEIYYLATHDRLTGLLNREGLTDLLDKVSPPKAAIFSDGTLKPVNDAYGHERGDQVIKDTARILEASMRETDVAARLGGDEMVVMLGTQPTADALTGKRRRPSSPESQLATVKHRIADLHKAYLERPENADLVAVGYDLAIGGAIWRTGMTTGDLIKAADADMYLVKQEQYRSRGYSR